MAILKNIAQEQVLPLAQQVEAEAGQIVSKTLAQNDAVSITLFAFSKGEEISTHASGGDAMVLVHCVRMRLASRKSTSQASLATTSTSSGSSDAQA